ncbi:MAG: zf-HC2 domain-containing protein [Acidobacteria bacterium]|nr:zf-HC2 domain-containing protein [Acidobacteriota bacterium]
MICEQIQPKLYLIADGESPKNDVAQVETHLVHCQECKSFYDGLMLENQSLSAALVVRYLPESEIRHLEARVLKQIAPPLPAVIIERVASLLDRLFGVVLVLVPYSVMLLLQVDTTTMSEKIAKSLGTGTDLFNFTLNVAVVILTTTLMIIYRNSVSWLSDKIAKGGVSSC